ncbi:amidase signature domain-containing protein [Sporodiniella umbellata]|nr:amidase signature domain-containing protein [Sporodiniella umbellata]
MFSRSTARLYLQSLNQRKHISFKAVQQSLNAIKAHNAEINAFVSINDRKVLEEKAKFSDARRLEGKLLGPLDGTPIAIKDNFCTTTLPTTCASNMLKDFTSPYDATVVTLLEKAGAIIVGKTNMDEFGMGSANVHSAFGPVVNPYKLGDKTKRSAGGSSGGSAACVAADMSKAALGSDTGGSVRTPASYCGIVGFKPSYGRCSRNGLVSYANSLDTVGILTKNISDCSDLYDTISKYDELDPTSIPVDLRKELDEKDNALRHKWENKQDLCGLVVGIPQEYYVDSLSDKVVAIWREGIEKLRSLGAEIVSVSMPHIPFALPSYYIIALAEASSNLARFDGMKYGYRSEEEDQLLFSTTRTQGFGAEVQRRILLGTHVLTAGTYETLFLPAQKARRLIQQDFDRVLKQPSPLYSATQKPGPAHVLLVPGATSDAPFLNDRSELVTEYINDVMTLPANLAGVPAIAVPFGKDKYPIGLQLMSQYGYDRFLLTVADKLINNH